MFKKYIHLERYGNDEVQGIELGQCYIFPKIDGTNGSLWWKDGSLQAGSRNRHLSLEQDNAGFMAWAMEQENYLDLFNDWPEIRLYGEWLVPHSLRSYHDEAWRKFYVFDVTLEEDDSFFTYESYKKILQDYDITFIPPVCVLKNATYDGLLKELENNKYLIKDGEGCGEGIVLKNYEYRNRFGRQIWAKMVTNTFKEKNTLRMGPTVKNCKEMPEQVICDQYVTKHLIDKTYAKIANEMEGWNSRYIPRLLSTVYYDLVKEELWDAVKQLKNPTVNFKTLNTLTTMKIKQVRPELF